MSYRLYVRPRPVEAGALPDEGSPWHYDWVLLDAGGQAQAEGADEPREAIEQVLARNDLEHVRLIALLPGENVLYCTARLPGKQSRYIRQALPFAVEEQLAQNIESVHLALGEKRGDDYAVAAIDEPLMADAAARLGSWSAELQAIHADAALLPVNDYRWSLCVEDDRCMVAGSEGEWYCLNTANLQLFFDMLPGTPELAVPARVRVFATASSMDSQRLHLASLEQLANYDVTIEQLEMAPLQLLAHAHHHRLSNPINLAQDDFAPVSRQGGPWRRWRPVAIVAAIWFLLQVGLELGQGIYYEREAQAWQQQAVTLYQSIFPGETRVSWRNLKNSLKGKLRVASQQGPNLDFLTLMKQAGYQYSTLPNRGQLQFNSVNYSRDRGELVLEVRADTFDKLNQLKSGLASAGLEARIGSVVNDSNSARGRITVSGG